MISYSKVHPEKLCYAFDFVFAARRISRHKTQCFYFRIQYFYFSVLFCYQIYKDKLDINCQYLVVIIFTQIILGMLTLISDSSILLALLHQVSAILLMLILLKIKHLLSPLLNRGLIKLIVKE